MDYIFIYKDKIYYSDVKDWCIYSMDMDGKNKVKIRDNVKHEAMSLVKDKIVYKDRGETAWKIIDIND
jgi:hypothetical protein